MHAVAAVLMFECERELAGDDGHVVGMACVPASSPTHSYINTAAAASIATFTCPLL